MTAACNVITHFSHYTSILDYYNVYCMFARKICTVQNRPLNEINVGISCFNNNINCL